MAVLESLPGVEVCVCVDGNALEEYKDDEEVKVTPGPVGEHQASKTVSKYIESITGKEFCIRATISPAFLFDCPRLSFKLRIDGKRMDGVLSSKHLVRTADKLHLVKSNIMEMNGLRLATDSKNPHSLLKKFTFAKNETCRINLPIFISMGIYFLTVTYAAPEGSELDIKKDREYVESLGEIVVTVFRVSKGTKTKSQNFRSSASLTVAHKQQDNGTVIHEKALKGEAKSHCTL
jgi:hypothetical protein